jgi:hypothetical protein
MKTLFPDLKITWWFEDEIQQQLMEHENEGINKFYFEKEIISLKKLQSLFEYSKAGWLHERYIPELHGQGEIQNEIQKLVYSKDFRTELANKLSKTVLIFKTALSLIHKLIPTLKTGDKLISDLEVIIDWLDFDLQQLEPVGKSIDEGVEKFNIPVFRKVKIERSILDQINAIKASNEQMSVKDKILDVLQALNTIDLHDFVQQIALDSHQNGRLFLGDAGTGKTHGLTNIVEVQLRSNSPAVIIRAQGTPCKSWKEILCNALEIDNWSKDQILSALENVALRNDHMMAAALNAGDDQGKEYTKVVICIDGLEEDSKHWREWYERMREASLLMVEFPRIKFVFSARTYFLNETSFPKDDKFKYIFLPREGDVPVLQVIHAYFSPEQYNITVSPFTLVRGIDTLFALRLFCELYKDRNLTASDGLETAEKVLLRKKVEKINDDFVRKMESDISVTRRPVADALLVISESFYSSAEIEHSALFGILGPVLGTYLKSSEIDFLIDYLANNGLLNKMQKPDEDDLLSIPKYVYSLPYQSIMELIMSDKYTKAIVDKKLTSLPEFLIERTDANGLINNRIIQNIANTLLYENDILLGQDGFMADGLTSGHIEDIKIQALIKAPDSIALKYKGWVDEMYFKDFKSRHAIFKKLILPSAVSFQNYFGAEYLHRTLLNQATAFERESIWLGHDGYNKEDNPLPLYNLQNLLDNEYGDIYISDFALHNEMPLIYGWALATIDQKFREKIRLALTIWGIKQPAEFVLLLEKLFSCNDPQIQEDLASITLGLATKLKDKNAIESIAHWALGNVFSKVTDNRNVIVRQGFRTICERAYKNNSITEEQVKHARPRIMEKFEFIELDTKALENPKEEIYPIVHDLAWYVIKKAYDDFLSNSYSSNQEDSEDWDDEDDDIIKSEVPPIVTEEEIVIPATATDFLGEYMVQYGIEDLWPRRWAMAAAIGYMKKLGFNRTKGNGMTEASHGSKSKIFTLEEKYTWLAVRYIQGYLADYIPFSDYNVNKIVNDYSLITDIPNPAEDLNNRIYKSDKIPNLKGEWVIAEPLTPELDDIPDFDAAIKSGVENEPELNLEKWIEFTSSDFLKDQPDENWEAILNHTKLHESLAFMDTTLDARACIIKKGQTSILLDIMRTNPKNLHFLSHLDGLVGSPQTDIYSNPTDIVWMDWIQENNFSEDYYTIEGEQVLLYSLTSITTDTVDGEKHEVIPSKKVRELLGITDLDGKAYVNRDGRAVAYSHTVSGNNYDNQQIIFVNSSDFKKALDKNELEVVWFVNIFKSKNALNDKIKSDLHPMKCRKYFVYREDEKLNTLKIWDARFCNRSDE